MKCEKEGCLKFIPRIFRPALRNFRLFNRDYGHFRTRRQAASVNAAGAPIPWHTYPATEYVQQLDLAGRTIFEYGSGCSTLFYATRCDLWDTSFFFRRGFDIPGLLRPQPSLSIGP